MKLRVVITFTGIILVKANFSYCTFSQVFYQRADFKLQSGLQPWQDDHDFAHHPLHLTNMGLLDHTYPSFRSDVVFVTNNPSKVEPMYNIVRVFDPKTWLMLIFTLMAVTLAYAIICRTTKVGKLGRHG